MIVLDMPFVLFRDRGRLPAVSGVYVVADDETVLYVGQARNLLRRWLDHHRQPQMCGRYRIYWSEVPFSDLDITERHLIEQLKPSWNGTQALSYSRFDFHVHTHQQIKALTTELDLDATAVVELAIAQLWKRETGESGERTPDEQRIAWRRRSGRLL